MLGHTLGNRRGGLGRDALCRLLDWLRFLDRDLLLDCLNSCGALIFLVFLLFIFVLGQIVLNFFEAEVFINRLKLLKLTGNSAVLIHIEVH